MVQGRCSATDGATRSSQHRLGRPPHALNVMMGSARLYNRLGQAPGAGFHSLGVLTWS